MVHYKVALHKYIQDINDIQDLLQISMPGEIWLKDLHKVLDACM